MENKIHIGDQNSQQIDQNHINQPTEIQTKPKVNYRMIFAAVFTLLFVIIIGVYKLYYGKVKDNQTYFPNPTPEISQTPKTINQQPTGIATIASTTNLTLENGGYGFTYGDIVQTKIGKPVVGDIIVYDRDKNKSGCLSMGSTMSLGKILGVPGETFSFQNDTLKIREEIVEFAEIGDSDEDYSQEKAVFLSQKYENLVGKRITLQTGEYLIDKWVGYECFAGELDETGSSIPYNRFTVNEEAISGVIDKKIGHDNQAEKEFRNRIY